MKVFEVRIETYDDDDEIMELISYVISEDDTLLTVVDHFTKHCEAYDESLKGVREVLTVVERIGFSDKKVKAELHDKKAYRSKPSVNTSEDMFKLDLRLSKKEWYKLETLLDLS